MERARRCRSLAFAAFSLVALVLPITSPGQTDETPLQVGITGSSPSEQSRNPTAILASAEVQRLMLEIAEAPRDRGYVEAAIAGRFFTLEDMVNVGLVREEDGLYWLDFNLLRVADQRAILDAAEAMGRDLADAFLARRARFESLAQAHAQPGVGRAELLYIVLGCFSLDWDGLGLTEERGYRAGAQRVLDGHAFTPWAKERGVTVSLKGLYWGSHNTETPAATLTTFGDHHDENLPRFGIPDLLWNSRGAFGSYGDIADGQAAASRMASVYLGDAMEDIAAVMMSLRTTGRSAHETAAETGIAEDKIDAILRLLEVAEYVEQDGGAFRSSVLVLGPEDAEMVSAMMAEGRRIMTTWHEDNYDSLRARLSGLTPIRNGVPYERVYTEIWHFVFAIANRTLVERGFFADPYADSRRFKGFLPVVFANGIDEL